MAAVICDICGMRYVPKIPEDFREHKKYHDIVVNGLPARPLKSDCVIWSKDDLHITVVKDTSLSRQQRRAEEIGMLARRDTPYGAEDLFGENDTHVFLLHSKQRGIGLLALEKCQYVWKTCWHDWESGKQPEKMTEHYVIWSIFMIWILKHHRRKGLGQILINKAISYLGCDLQNVGWREPFTKSGEAIIRRLCWETFYIAK